MFHRLFITVILLCSLPAYALTQESSITNQKEQFIGDWRGALGETWYDDGLKVVFHINKTDQGFVSSIDSIDQGTFISTAKTIIKGNSLIINAPIVDGVYQATLDGDILIGTWTQYGKTSEMNLKRED